MATVRRRLDPANPPHLSAETKARLDAMTPEQIEHNAAADPDNPPMTPGESAPADFSRRVRAARQSTGLTQARFAEEFRINPARLRDWEQGRFAPDSVALAYLRVIEREPEAVERALRETA